MSTLVCLSVLLMLMTSVAPVTSTLNLGFGLNWNSQDILSQLKPIAGQSSIISNLLSPLFQNKNGCNVYPCQHSCTGTGNTYQCSCDAGYKVSAADPTKCEAVNICDITCISCSLNIGTTKCNPGYRTSASDKSKCEDIDECIASPCQHNCTNTPGSYKCSCRDGYQVNALDATKCDVTPCAGNPQIDMMVVMDSSGSIGNANYVKAWLSVVNLLSGFKINPANVQVAALIFSKIVQKLFDFNTFTNIQDISRVLAKAPYLNSLTYTHLALNYVSDNDMYGTKCGGRVNSLKVLLLLTDGVSENTSLTRQAAAKLKANNVLIIVIAIGKGVDMDEINAVASGSDCVFTADSYSALAFIEAKVAARACGPQSAAPTQKPAATTKSSNSIIDNIRKIFG